MASYNKPYSLVVKKLLKDTSKQVPEFTNYTDTDPLVNLIKLTSAMTVSSSEYSEKYLDGKFIQHPSSADEKTMYLLLEQFDMVPQKIVPGTITVIFEYVETPNSETYATIATSTVLPDDEDSNKSSITSQLIIPKGTVFLVGDVPFTILSDYYIKAYNSYTTITIVEGKYRSQDFYRSSIRNNRIKLDSDSVATDYIKVIIDNEEYGKISHAEYSSLTDIFSIEYDINHGYNIVFSDKTVSDIPESAKIRVEYIESTGTDKYDAMSDAITIDSYVEYEGRDVKKNIVRNTVVGYTTSDTHHDEGFNYEMIPIVMPTFKKAITTEDFTNLTRYFPGVAVSRAYDINSPEHANPELNILSDYLTKVVAAPTTGYYISNLLRNNLIKYFEEIGIEHSECAVEILDPVYIILNLTLGVNVSTNNQPELLDLYSSISKTIEDYFEVGNIKFGSYIAGDYIASLVAKLDERINYVDVLEFSDKNGSFYSGYQLNAIELPLLGNLEIIFNYKNISVSDTIDILDDIPTFRAEFLIELRQDLVTDEIILTQNKTVIPKISEVQETVPDEDYDYLSTVLVTATPITEVDNPSGGKTTIIAEGDTFEE